MKKVISEHYAGDAGGFRGLGDWNCARDSDVRYFHKFFGFFFIIQISFFCFPSNRKRSGNTEKG